MTRYVRIKVEVNPENELKKNYNIKTHNTHRFLCEFIYVQKLNIKYVKKRLPRDLYG